MSYQVLARKWRPATFEQVVGQAHVLHALVNALTQQRLHHAYLFTGTRGVGKTSLARLFAKGLNCETGVTATPCGQCDSCIEIAQGRFVDLIEVDAASRTKVDDTREILDNVQYRPTRGRYKVYLIDEVHMLSRSSFNALLKTLEEPPEHVKFLLATTDPQKLPITVLSRCLQFNLKSLTQEDIGNQLKYVLEQEQLKHEQEALTLLAKAANGSMRDALSLTDQAIAFGGGEVMLKQVQTMLGSIDERHVIGLLQALCHADVNELMTETAKVISFGAEPEEVLRSLLELLHQITLTQFAPAASQLSMYAEQIKAFAEQLSPEQVQLYYQILLSGRKELPYAPDPKSGLEMALLRAIAFVPQAPVTKWESKPSEQAPVSEPVKINVPEVVAEPVQTQVEQAVAPQPSQVEVKANTEVDELEAEQALLMSQAESQGYQPQMVDTPAGDIATNNGDMLNAEPQLNDSVTQMPEPSVVAERMQTEMVSTPDQTPIESAVKSSSDDPLDQILQSRDALLFDLESEQGDEDAPAKKAEPRSKRSLSVERKPVSDTKEKPNNSSKEVDAVKAEAPKDTPPWEEPVVESPEGEKSSVATAEAASKPASAEQVQQTNHEATEVVEKSQLPQTEVEGDSTDLYWYKLMSLLELGGRIRQLAVNSVCVQFAEQLQLLLKPDQKHLAAPGAIEQLKTELEKYLEQSISLDVQIGVDDTKETPLEIRKRFHRSLLDETEQLLNDDQHVSWLKQHMGASLNIDSLGFPREKMLAKTASIAKLDFNSAKN
ncbi:DNA polymerase III subunit gamma/tau [Parashewanella curva]|uniref:DNA polymerase III subunit gamma/tau n=1 Tax=Parashewanella curva TaxID=2338552 RepID=A0A3L8PZZ2_9GAMM|nr:DNA polymerase III subunit gamma/tau [Parashewanella curva]RLV61026.1 DNA polymerase III subunit gamma/tau [Parashewanella curva]